jgi:hypothetical protein
MEPLLCKGGDVILVPWSSRDASGRQIHSGRDYVVHNIGGGEDRTCPLCEECTSTNADPELDNSEVDGSYTDMVFFCTDCGITFDCCCELGNDTFCAKFVRAVVDRQTGECFEGMPVFPTEVDCFLLLKDTWTAVWDCTCTGACGFNCCKPQDSAAVVIQRCVRDWLRRRREAAYAQTFKRDLARHF